MLRVFNHIYLNDTLLTEALSALEGGTIGETEEVQRSGKERGASLDVGAGPARAGGKLSGSAESETRMTRKDTPEARLQRLIRALEGEEALPLYDASTESDRWYTARRGVLFEAEGQLDISLMSSLAKPLEDLQGLMKLAGAFGVGEDIDLPDDQLSQLHAAANLTKGRPIPFTFTVAGAEECRAFGELDPAHLGVEPTEASGEFILFAKVVGFLSKDENFDMTGMLQDVLRLSQATSRSERRRQKRAAAREPTASADNEFLLKGPALKIIPYAVVR